MVTGRLLVRDRASCAQAVPRFDVFPARARGTLGSWSLAFGVTLLLSGCLDSNTVECSWGMICGADRICYDPLKRCVLPIQLEACADFPVVAQDGGAAEDDGDEGLPKCSFPGSGSQHRCRLGVCEEPFCGDGEPDEEEPYLEECDDGNEKNGDGCSSDCKIETLQWNRLVLSQRPSARSAHAMLYHASRETILLFGGREAVTNDDEPGVVAQNDTWEFDGDGWQQVDSAQAPPARHGHAMAYDDSRDLVVLFGGSGPSAEYMKDTWEFDGATWQPIVVDQSPPQRQGHAMVYDHRSACVLLAFGQTNNAVYSDLWRYDRDGWKRIDPTGGNSPSARSHAAMAYDEKHDRTVLFGGFSRYQIAVQGDTWALDGGNWRSIVTQPAPPARWQHSLVYNPDRQRLLLFGGLDLEGNPLDDAWELDGDRWTELATGVEPIGWGGHRMSYSPVAGAGVVFGGIDASGQRLRDTWRWAWLPLEFCGNGKKENGEACDGSDFGLLSCQELGFAGGRPSCTTSCTVETDSCERER